MFSQVFVCPHGACGENRGGERGCTVKGGVVKKGVGYGKGGCGERGYGRHPQTQRQTPPWTKR